MQDLQRLMDGRDCAYVYDRATLANAARALKGVKSAARVLYAMKANPHPEDAAAVPCAGAGLRLRVARRNRTPAGSGAADRPQPHSLHAELHRPR